MLQSQNSQSDIRPKLNASDLQSGAELVQSLIGFLRRQLTVIIFAFLLIMALGVIYIATARPSYTAQAQLLIDAHNVHLFQTQAVVSDAPIDVAQVESQVQVLKSENIASAVIKNLHLTEDPEFVGPQGGFIGALISFVLNPIAYLTSYDDSAPSQFELVRRAMGAFKAQLEVNRIGLSYVININFRAYDPERAAQIANEVADAYIVDQMDSKYQATRRAGAWLQDRIKELRDQASNAERSVVVFKTQHNIVNTGNSDRPLLSQQQVAELSSQLVIARTRTAEAKARLDRINSVLKADLPSESFGETVADTLKNEVVTQLRTKYLELAAREADWSAKYGRNHLAVINVRNQMQGIRNSIFEELKRLAETYKSDYDIATKREQGMQAELAQAVAKSQQSDEAAITLHDLESTSQTYKSLYENFLQKYMESVQQQSFPITEARVISPATRPLQKSHPRSLLVLAVAGLGGMAFGLGLGMLRDMSDRVFRTSDQVADLLEADCIALVPLLMPNQGNNPDAEQRSITNNLLSRATEALASTTVISDLYGSYKAAKDKVSAFSASVSGVKETISTQSFIAPKLEGPRIIAKNDKVFWTVIESPLSRFTESIRSIKLAIDLDEKENRVIGFTSSLPNEGKSTIAAALSQLMSQVGARTIIVDCDLRNPSLSRSLTPSAQAGILEVITGKASLEEVLWTEPSINMTFLPAVVKSRIAHSNEILSSATVKKFFEKLRERYDYIIVDLPPLAPVVDVRAMTHLIDSFVFVVEWGRTKIDIVEHALLSAKQVHQNLLGIVLNKVDMNTFGRHANYRQSYYYNSHYSRYGYTE